MKTLILKNEQRTLSLWKKLALLALTVSALGLTPALAAQADAAGARKADASATTPAADDADAPSGTVNLNTASEDELMMLPGVGPSKAAAIVAWRKKYGGFKKVDDLSKVKGFGYKTMKKLKPYLAITGATTYKGKKARGEGSAEEAASQP
jgi:competence protein ComEA